VTPPRRRLLRTALVVRVLVVAAAFVVGVALGAALDDNPDPGTTTFERDVTIVTVTGTP
jgi:hypothetical protein